jgi:DNA-binding protein H-NS
MAINLKKLNQDQLRELINHAKQRQNDLARQRVGVVRDKILALLKTEKLTFEDVFGGRASRRGRKLGKVKPKYRNPADPGQTWSGRGKRPRWFTAALGQGRKEKDLLI